MILEENRTYEFAIKWLEKFREENINFIELVDHFMADECEELGFVMDCGNSFEEKYGKAVFDYNELKRIIDNVTDVKLLGSTIYSRWRYFNHWAYTGEEILKPENRAWFITALERLSVLASVKPIFFEGVPQKIQIVSNGICYGPCPEPEDIVEQHITINAEGGVWYSAFKYGSDYGKYEKAETKNYKIDKATALNVLDAVVTYFSNHNEDMFVTDVGSWDLKITNTEGIAFKFWGSLCGSYEIDDIDVCNLIRVALEIDDLFVFDGQFKPDPINKIAIDYHRITKIKPKEIPDGASWEYATWDYTEQLIIDRETESLEHIQNIGTGCVLSHKYKVQDGIACLLDDLNTDYLFDYIEGNNDEVVDELNETKDYAITIDYKKNPQRVICGTFDKKGLPDDFDEFAETIYDFMCFYGMGEILNPSIYKKIKNGNYDYIYCSVTFDEGGKSYYYIADDDRFEVGDYVVVPVGKDGHESVAEIVDIEYFAEDDVPLPLDKTKYIIRKTSENNIIHDAY